MIKLFRKPFYGLLALLCDRVFAKGTDYNSLDDAYRILWAFNNDLCGAALRLGRTVDDWRLTTRNPQNKIKDLWGNELP